MDNDTFLLVFGDHGMNMAGKHGGGSEGELRTAIFAYHKKGFPFKDLIPPSHPIN